MTVVARPVVMLMLMLIARRHGIGLRIPEHRRLHQLPQRILVQRREGARAAAGLAMARIGVHCARHAWFLDEAQLLRDAHRLREIPGVIVQGAHDRVTPPAAGLALHRAWPGSQWRQVDGAGHSSRHPEVARELIAATDAFADRQQDPRRRP